MTMEVSYSKLFFSIILMFTMASADLHSKNFINCSLITGPSPTSEVMPIKYNVQFTINPEMETVSTKVDIIIQVKQSIRNISLHIHNMKTQILTSKIMMVDALQDCNYAYELRNLSYCEKNNILMLMLETNTNSQYYCIHLELISFLSDDILNFPYYSDKDYDKRLITNLYAPNAIRGLFPCWDDPTIKASFNISVKHSINYTVLSNTRVWYKSIEGDGTQWTHFREITSMPTYFLGIVMISGMKKHNEFESINFFWHELNETTRLKYAQNIVHLTIAYLAEYTKTLQSDIIKKIDHIIVPNGPMKSAGKHQLVIYREKDIIYDEISDNFGQNIDILTLVTYEIARQWFVGFVSPHLKSDIWINEILASFYSYYITAQFLETERTMALFVVQNLQTALDSDVYLELEPIIHKTRDNNGIDGLLYPLLYHKKAFALIRMLYYLLTPEVFQDAIVKYVYRHTENLWTVLEQYYTKKINSRYTIKEIIDSWLTTARHPTLTIVKENRRRIVSYTSDMTKRQNNDFKWKIPLNYIMQSNFTSYNITNVVWLEQDQVEIISNIDLTDFYILNVEQIGFYRVNYDRRNWLMIASYLQFNVYSNIPAINRAQLINDAYYYTVKGELDLLIFIELIRYLEHETDYIPWYPMFNILVDMSTYLQYSRTYATKQHFLYILHGLLQKVGYKERLEDDGMTKSLRLLALKWSCKLGHIYCRKTATDQLTTYIHNKSRAIPLMWKNWVLCTGMMTATSNVWDTILQENIQYKNLETFEHLTCTEDVRIIMYYLSLTLHKDLQEQVGLQMGKIYLSLVKKHVRKDTVLKYVLDNYNTAVNRFPVDFENGTLIGHIVMSVDSMEVLNQIHTFVRHTLHFDDHQMYVFQKSSAARSQQIMKEQSKFEMF